MPRLLNAVLIVLMVSAEPLLTIELLSSGVPWPPAWLVAPPNEPFVRGAAWATADVDEPWVVGLLGRLALRGAAPSPHPKVTTALCHAVASGAIEALAAIGTPLAHAELRTLLGEMRRRDLLKRVAALLGEPLETTLARDERVRREKRRLVQEARKNSGFEVSDRVVLRWAASGETAEAMREHADLVADEVLAVEMAEVASIDGDNAVRDDDLGLAFTVAKA